MKKILVPTDFSACANYAFEAAILLAKHLNAEIILCHNLYFLNESNYSFETACLELKGDRLQELENINVLMQSWTDRSEGLVKKVVYLGNYLVDALNILINKEEVELVVIGSHGKSGKNEYFMGSNAQKIVRAVHCNTLVIKEPLKELKFKDVVFASNFGQQNKAVFLRFLDFIQSFSPKVHLVYINTDPFWGLPYSIIQQEMEEYRNLCKDLACKTHYYRDFTVERGVRHISDELDADLIAISNQQRHPIKRILMGSNVEFLVNHADIPLLSLDK
ncbi:MAG: universal stress protein [Bacteroidota bacterium]